MSFYKLLFFWLIITFAVDSFAQLPDSTIELSQVEIIATRILEKQSKTHSTQTISSSIINSYSTKTLNNLLSKNTNITINQYGASGLSSVSMRGGNANHTAILWNGFNLQDPLNGEFNLSLSTINIIDEIEVNYGGNSALFGSGAVGGTIQLNNKENFNSKLRVGIEQSIGSFGKQNSLFNISFGTKRLFLRTRLFFSSVDNDFEYVNYAKKGFPKDTLNNSANKKYGILQEISYKLNAENKISAQIWYQSNYSEIAPNMTVSNGLATQYDDFTRIATTYNKKGDKLDLEIKNGLFFTKLNYIKPEINLDVLHTSINNITEGVANYKHTKRSSFLFGINNNFIKAESDNYNKSESLNKTAFFLSYKLDITNKFLFTANIRNELIHNNIKPSTFGIKAEYSINKHISINSNISKNYRTPNFNDLYWIGAYGKGNPNLQDENGYSADLGINLFIKKERFDISTNLTAYYSSFSNLIHWQPEGDIWSPQNKKLVVTNGIEFRINSKYHITKKASIITNINYTYTDAILKEKADNEDNSVLGKQLIYIPYYQANGLIGFQYSKVRADVITKYVGQRYTSADNKNWLNYYVLTDINISYSYSYKKVSGSIFLNANNIFNTEYMNRAWYPTPLANYEIGFKITFN